MLYEGAVHALVMMAVQVDSLLGEGFKGDPRSGASAERVRLRPATDRSIPRPDARRRAISHVVWLPPEGNTEPTPVWPLGGDPGPVASKIWAEVWSLPQSVGELPQTRAPAYRQVGVAAG